MRFHLGSFALGFASGFTTAKMAPRLRRVGVELLTIGVRIADRFAVRIAQGREDLEDLVAEARARARGQRPGVQATNGGTEPRVS